ncbi:MAG: hypothetical protein GXP50_01445 [Deltaproteobacteria bacterium]|nr:hypothetical protein [Deltaproteobacteria bacterium]
MRRFWSAALAAAAGLVLASGLAFADQTSQAMKKVQVHIDPNIAVSGGVQVTQQSFQAGEIPVDVAFTVHANTQWVTLQAMGTPLYKADDPMSPYEIPIDLAADVMVDILPDENGVSGNPSPGYDWGLAWSADSGECSEIPVTPDGRTWPWFCTETSIFESGNNGTFSHDLVLTFTWFNEDNELPKGDYSGWVKLIAWTYNDP